MFKDWFEVQYHSMVLDLADETISHEDLEWFWALKLRYCCNVPGDIPRQQFIDPVDGMLGNVRQHMPQIILWNDAIEFGCLD